MRSTRIETHHLSRRRFALLVSGTVAAALLGAQVPSPSQSAAANPRAFLDAHCIACHNQKLRTAGLALDNLDAARPSANAEVWERVIAKLRAGSMPPPGIPRPAPAAYRAVAGALE